MYTYLYTCTHRNIGICTYTYTIHTHTHIYKKIKMCKQGKTDSSSFILNDADEKKKLPFLLVNYFKAQMATIDEHISRNSMYS